MERGLVSEDAVRRLAVIAQSLTVVGRHDHERGPIRPAADVIEQRPEGRIGEGNLTRVEVAGVLRCEGLWRSQRSVRIVDVYPGEPLLTLRGEPLQRGLDDFVGPPLAENEVGGARDFVQAVVVHVETRVEAEL